MTYTAADMNGCHWVFEAEARGSKVMIRRHPPHGTGNGEIIARQVELSDAQFICQVLNAASHWDDKYGTGQAPEGGRE